MVPRAAGRASAARCDRVRRLFGAGHRYFERGAHVIGQERWAAIAVEPDKRGTAFGDDHTIGFTREPEGKDETAVAEVACPGLTYDDVSVAEGGEVPAGGLGDGECARRLALGARPSKDANRGEVFEPNLLEKLEVTGVVHDPVGIHISGTHPELVDGHERQATTPRQEYYAAYKPLVSGLSSPGSRLLLSPESTDPLARQ